MLASRLLLTPTEGMPRPDWLALRQQSIGGSDMGAILGLNPYMSRLELFYKFVESHGSMQKQETNLSMELGHELEPVVANLWCHWDGSEESLTRNLRDKTPVAECVTLPYHIKNPQWDFLHANLDRGIVRNRHGRTGGVLEIKTIASLAADKYEDGIPPSYPIQVQHYLAVCELDFAELAMLKDGRQLEVYEFERNEGFIAHMLAEATEFWRGVQEGRRIWADATASVEQRHQWLADIQPEADDSAAYEQFLRARWRSDAHEVRLAGTEEHLLLLDGYHEAGRQLKTYEGRQQHYKNQLLAALSTAGADYCLLDGGGKFSFRADKNGKRTFRASPGKK